MKFIVPLLGKTAQSYLDAGIRDYAGRLSRFVTLEMPLLKDRHGRKDPGEVLKTAEAGQFLTYMESAGFCVALDPRGQTIDSEALATLITGWQDRGIGSVCFLIGGPVGLHQSLLDRADCTLSLSALTFTHEMARLILLEQLYRAWTIKAGQKYHK